MTKPVSSDGLTFKKALVTSLVARTFPEEPQRMLAIFTCESNLRTEAIGDTALQYVQDGMTYGASYGVAQIRYLPGRPNPKWLLNPINNLAYARRLYLSSGVEPWTCSHRIGLSNPGHVQNY